MQSVFGRYASLARFVPTTDEGVFLEASRICGEHGIEADFFASKLELFLLNRGRELSKESLEEFRLDLSRLNHKGKIQKVEKQLNEAHLISSTGDRIIAHRTTAETSGDRSQDPSRIHPLASEEIFLGFDSDGRYRSDSERNPTNEMPRDVGAYQSFLDGIDSSCSAQARARKGASPEGTPARHCSRAEAPSVEMTLGLASSAAYVTDYIEKRVETVRERIFEASRMLCDRGFDLPLGRANHSSNAESLIVGRVRLHDSKKEAWKDVFLEDEEGVFIRLDLSKISKFILYPGKIIGVIGRNPTGQIFEVERILDAIFAPEKRHRPRVRTPLSNSTHQMPRWRALFAAGPYVCAGEAPHTAIEKLGIEIQELNPNLVCFFGPLLSETANHAVENVAKDPQSTENGKVLGLLLEIAQRMPHTRFLLCPSLDDAMHPIPVLPQRPYDFATNPALRLGNPSQFQVRFECGDYINVAVTSSTIIDDLQHVSLQKGHESSPISDYVAEIIGQGSFHPLAVSSQASAVDYSLLNGIRPACPDILVVAGSTRSLAKEAHGCCIVCLGSASSQKNRISFAIVDADSDTNLECWSVSFSH